MEQNEKRQSLLRQLLRILERDLAHQRHTLLLRPHVQLVKVGQAARVRLVVVVRQINVGPVYDDWRAGRMHLRDRVAKAHLELAVVLQVGGDPPERLVLGLVAPIKVADDDAFARVQLLQLLEIGELVDGIVQLGLDEIDECVDRAFAAILAFRGLAIADDLERGILGDLEAGRDRRLFVAVHFAHDDFARLGERLAHLGVM